MNDELSLDYYAGVFDGEGHIGITLSAGPKRKQRGHTLICSVAMTHELVIRRFHSRFSGHFRGPEHRPNRQPMFVWRVCSKKAQAFLETIHSHLFVKADQAQIGLEFVRTRVRMRFLSVEELTKRDSYRTRLHALHGIQRLRRSEFVPNLEWAAKVQGQRDQRVQCLALAGLGKSRKEIAATLGVSVQTVARLLTGRGPKASLPVAGND